MNLSSPDFYLRGPLKGNIHRNNPHTLRGTETNNETRISKITQAPAYQTRRKQYLHASSKVTVTFNTCYNHNCVFKQIKTSIVTTVSLYK